MLNQTHAPHAVAAASAIVVASTVEANAAGKAALTSDGTSGEAASITLQSYENEGSPTYLALGRLRVDELNARLKPPTEAELNELADLIDSQGLLQNLIVIEYRTPRPYERSGKGRNRGKGRKGSYTHGVVAGGRRLRALLILVQRGRMTLDTEVLCTVVPIDRARAISVAENSGRQAMSVPDTVSAFASMVADGADVESIAVAFGITPLTVRRRLKLAAVSPRLFDLFRAGEIKLEQLMALALTDDHARQEAAWDGSPAYSRSPEHLRRVIVGASADRALVRFVGLPAYEAAGGRVLRDLFAEQAGDQEDACHIEDVALLQSLAVANLNATAEAMRAEGAAWVEVMLSLDYTARQEFRSAPAMRRAATEAEAAEEAAIEAQLAELNEKIEAFCEDDCDEGEEGEEGDDDGGDEAEGETRNDGGDNDSTATREQVQAWELEAARLDDALNAMLAKRMVLLPEVAALAGTLVYVASNGTLGIERHLIRKADRKAAEKITAKAQQAARGEAGEDPADDHAGNDSVDDEASVPVSNLSESLCRALTSHRTRAIQALMAGNPRIALAALAHPMLCSLIYGVSGNYEAPSALGVRSSGCDAQLNSWAKDLAQSPASRVIDQYVAQCKKQLPKQARELLPWLLEQQTETLVHLLALCAALTVEAISGKGGKHPADALATALALDMAEFWTPTAAGYLSRVPKQQIADAVSEAGMADEAAALLKLKKGEAAERAENLLAGKRWLPAVLA